MNKLSNAWTEFSLAVGGAFLDGGLTAGIQALTDLAKVASVVIDKLGFLPVVLATASTAVILLSKNSRTLAVALTQSTFGMNAARASAAGLEVGMSRAAVATHLLKGALRGLMAATVVGAGLAVIGVVIEKLTNKYAENKEAQIELESQQNNFVKSVSENGTKVEELTDKFEKLQNQINSGKYDDSTMSEYLSVQNELAELVPQLAIGEDSYGNSILGTSLS